MNAYKRSIILQIIVFVFFFFYGLDKILNEMMSRSTVLLTIELIVVLIIIGLGVFYYLKTPVSVIFVVKKTHMDQVKYILYAMSAALIIGIFNTGFSLTGDIAGYINIFTGAILGLASIYGIYISYQIMNQNK